MRVFSFYLLCFALIAGGLLYLYRRPEAPRPARTGFLTSGPASIRLPVGRTKAVLRLADRAVRVEIENPGGARIPAVLLVHDGSELRGSAIERVEARVRDLAARGFLVAVADYGSHDPAASGSIVAELLGEVLLVANVDESRIGAAGIRRGATIALAVASVAPRLAALALHSPAMPGGFETENVTNLPRTLVILGDRDEAAVATMNILEGMFLDRGRAYAVHLQEGVGADPDERALADGWSRMLAFFGEYL